ncbi:MAG: transcription termination factor Rho, partial [Planctomycetota bacterium]|nr:transcription termination factor Rho [Planctomycetota bacterium]
SSKPHRRRNRRNRRRRGGGGAQTQKRMGAFPPPSQLPHPPEEAWSEKNVKSFATKRKKAENHLTPILSIALPELQELGEELGVEGAFGMARGPLLRRLVRQRMEDTGVFFTKGILDIEAEGHAYLRHGVNDYTPNADTDALLHRSLVEKHNLVSGQEVSGVLAPISDDENALLVLHDVLSVFGEDSEKQYANAPFGDLVPLYPEERLHLETEQDGIEARIVDLISPVGKGQRGLIVAPPRTGKTVLLQIIANAIVQKHPDCHLIILLVDERPEEVTDFSRTVTGENREIVASTFDESPARHIKVAEMVIQRAKRMVEQGRDVVVLLDSITRLARAYNNEAPSNSKIMTGGLVADALQKPKRFFGAARNMEDGGSLTILATALIDTNSKMDEVIFEEFKGTGNMELVLDRQLADRRIWPAIDINRSGTRKEDLLFTPDELQRVWLLRKVLNDMNPVEAMELLVSRMQKSSDNTDFLVNLSVG